MTNIRENQRCEASAQICVLPTCHLPLANLQTAFPIFVVTMSSYHYIKLGGSLITDKTRALTPRPRVIQRLARELAAARAARPDARWILGHGSGSYGHVVGQKYAIRSGVQDARGWQGFVETGYIAGQLHRWVLAALIRAGLPAISFPPSALITSRDGHVRHIHVASIQAALEHGLIPLVYGDVVFDATRGGVILSTEEVFAGLAAYFPPERLTLVGLVDGVYTEDPARNPQAQRIAHLRLEQLDAWRQALGGSHGADVTGGMAGKIQAAARLIQQYPSLHVHLLSGQIPGHLQTHLIHPDLPLGTTLSA